jgi:hypothetical protein
VLVVLSPSRGEGDVEDATAALLGLTAAFRAEVARSIHRKRVPELAFEVRSCAGVDRG